MKNLAVYDENDYEMLQKRAEMATWKKDCIGDDIREIDVCGFDDVNNEFEETCIDLCCEGFVLINNRLVRRDDA
jgi:hypothetical protein